MNERRLRRYVPFRDGPRDWTAARGRAKRRGRGQSRARRHRQVDPGPPGRMRLEDAPTGAALTAVSIVHCPSTRVPT